MGSLAGPEEFSTSLIEALLFVGPPVAFLHGPAWPGYAVATVLSSALSQKKFVVQFLKPGEKKEREAEELSN